MIFAELAALWIAKKTLVLLAARAYGFKRLYRRILEVNKSVLAKRSPTLHGFVFKLTRKSFEAALEMGKKIEGRAQGRKTRAQRKLQREPMSGERMLLEVL